MGTAPARYPESPCIGVCRIGAGGLCEGCLRTLDEIAAWASLDEDERAAVYERLVERGGRAAVSTAAAKTE